MTNQRQTITVSETLHVERSPEAVFDYTQDYGYRPDWDRAVSDVQILGDSPRRIRLAVRGLGRFTVEYRLFRRGERTSAAFVEVQSRWISGGGGSWRYDPVDGGTNWTQTNTFELRLPFVLRWIGPIFERSLRSSMRRSMAEAKRIMESGGGP